LKHQTLNRKTPIKVGVSLDSLPPASRAAFSWVEMPAGANDTVAGGYFMTGWDYVKVGGWMGGMDGC
jgi:hypothetical protein